MMIRTAALLAFVALGACASPPPAKQEVEREVVIAGGYSKADPATVKPAEDLAVAEIYKRDPQRGLVENVEVQAQVVAGMNYRFDITMTGGKHYKVTVFRSLQGEYSVTDYEKVGG